MKTGIILDIDCKEKKALVLQTGGRYITIKSKPHWQKGDIISFKERKTSMKVFYAAVVCFAFFIIGAGYMKQQEPKVVAPHMGMHQNGHGHGGH